MFYKIRFTITTCSFKTLHDLKMKIIGLTHILKTAHNKHQLFAGSAFVANFSALSQLHRDGQKIAQSAFWV